MMMIVMIVVRMTEKRMVVNDGDDNDYDHNNDIADDNDIDVVAACGSDDHNIDYGGRDREKTIANNSLFHKRFFTSNIKLQN